MRLHTWVPTSDKNDLAGKTRTDYVCDGIEVAVNCLGGMAVTGHFSQSNKKA